MEEIQKRKTHTSSTVKNRYNAKTYDRITVNVKKEVAEKFKKKCEERGEPFSQVFHRAITAYLGE
ncbi:hypothetical protein FACS1894120_4310 [Clostridia bacterium]|nr:hypothetical protein FACS1894120_4310 [Clostridia bacterium]